MNNLSSGALICVDWGSSNLRAYLIDLQGKVLARLESDKGVLNVIAGHYADELADFLHPWLSFISLPVVMAGMVGSAQGWQDAGYMACPSTLGDLARGLCKVTNCHAFDGYIVPGVKGLSSFAQVDVMRGEEVQIFGALLAQHTANSSPSASSTQRVCLPGTHSKWAKVNVNHGQSPLSASISQFSTYMTGEIFSVLNKYSILGKMFQHTSDADSFDAAAFDAGVKIAKADGSLLHKVFSARTNVLDKTLAAAGVQSYLSGMLIASEVFDMLGDNRTQTTAIPDHEQSITLVGAPALCALYQRVIAQTSFNVRCVDAETASCLGVLNVAKAAEII